LSIAVKTVECHLSHIYAKLGVSSGPELAATMGVNALPIDAGTSWSSLTAREQQVAVAVGVGLSTRQAARRLYLSPRTVEFHFGTGLPQASNRFSPPAPRHCRLPRRQTVRRRGQPEARPSSLKRGWRFGDLRLCHRSGNGATILIVPAIVSTTRRRVLCQGQCKVIRSVGRSPD
jgi:DNA-binding CsgD family transcriptional regulator